MKRFWARLYQAFLDTPLHRRVLHPLCTRPGPLSALIYTSLALAAVGVFLGVTLAGDYTWVARGGGAAWVFGLSMIVLMPLVTPAVKRRIGAK